MASAGQRAILACPPQAQSERLTKIRELCAEKSLNRHPRPISLTWRDDTSETRQSQAVAWQQPASALHHLRHRLPHRRRQYRQRDRTGKSRRHQQAAQDACHADGPVTDATRISTPESHR